VVLSHLRLTFFSSAPLSTHFPSLSPWIARPLFAVSEGLLDGTFAVWVFWVLSAFVLSLPFFLLAKASENDLGRDYLVSAALRRYLRLFLPVLISVIFTYALYALGMMKNLRLAHILGTPYENGWLGRWFTFRPSFIGAVESAAWQSFTFFDYDRTYNCVLWTMPKELFGSWFMFLYLCLVGTRRSRIYGYGLTAIVFWVLGHTWLNAFIFGMAMCDAFMNREILAASLPASLKQALSYCLSSRWIAIAVWIAFLMLTQINNYRDIIRPFIASAIISWTLFSMPAQRILSSNVAQFLGRISFGLYLIHVPIICSFACWSYIATMGFLPHTVAILLSSLGTLCLSIGAGYLLYLFGDKPGIALSRKFSTIITNTAITMRIMELKK